MKRNILFLVACCIINLNHNIYSAIAAIDPSQYKKNCEALNGMKVENPNQGLMLNSNPNYLPLERCSLVAGDAFDGTSLCECYASDYPNTPIQIDEDTAAELANQRQNNQGLQESEKETTDQINKDLKEIKDVFSRIKI